MSWNAAIIHLSDIECGPRNRAAQESMVRPYQTCADRLIDDVREEIFRIHGLSGDRLGLVVSGDVVHSGGAVDGEYESAAELIEAIRDGLQIRKDRVAIVPGNHDANWVACEQAWRDLHGDDEIPDDSTREVIRSSPKKTEAFSRFLERVCGKAYPCPETVLVYDEMAALGLAVVGIDTTYPCTFCKDDNYGLVRDKQLDEATIAIRDLCKGHPEAIPLAIMHHCPIPIHDSPSQMNYMRNGMEVVDRLSAAGFAATLCGHEHMTRVTADGRRSYQVFATGSFGLGRRGLGERYANFEGTESNKYQILLLGARGTAKLLFRRLDNPGHASGNWVPDTDDGLAEVFVYPRRWSPRIGAVSMFPDVHPLVGRPVLLPGSRKYVVVMGLGGSLEVLRRIDQVIYVVSGRSISAENADENFIIDAELDVNGEKAVEIRIRIGPDVHSIGTVNLVAPGAAA